MCQPNEGIKLSLKLVWVSKATNPSLVDRQNRILERSPEEWVECDRREHSGLVGITEDFHSLLHNIFSQTVNEIPASCQDVLCQGWTREALRSFFLRKWEQYQEVQLTEVSTAWGTGDIANTTQQASRERELTPA